MSDWGWVAFAYTVVYGSLAAYVGWLSSRSRRTPRAESRR